GTFLKGVYESLLSRAESLLCALAARDIVCLVLGVEYLQQLIGRPVTVNDRAAVGHYQRCAPQTERMRQFYVLGYRIVAGFFRYRLALLGLGQRLLTVIGTPDAL